jgi:hypothetical protein
MAYFIATHYNTRHSPRSGFRASSLRDWPIVFAAPIRKVTTAMQTRPLDPPVDDLAPTEAVLTGYDEQHFVTYLRLLDAAAENADWREVARIVLHIDPDKEPERARRAWETHVARAEWLTKSGYRHLLRGGAPH